MTLIAFSAYVFHIAGLALAAKTLGKLVVIFLVLAFICYHPFKKMDAGKRGNWILGMVGLFAFICFKFVEVIKVDHDASVAQAQKIVKPGSTAIWKKVSVSPGITTYIDTSSIQRTGDIATAWELADYGAVPTSIQKTGEIATISELADYGAVPSNPFGYKSVARKYQFDCKNAMSAALTYVVFSERMGKGEITLTVNEAIRWSPLTPGSVGDVNAKTACRESANSN